MTQITYRAAITYTAAHKMQESQWGKSINRYPAVVDAPHVRPETHLGTRQDKADELRLPCGLRSDTRMRPGDTQ